MNICLLSNTNCDLIIASLKKRHNVYTPHGYGQWISYALSPDQELIDFNPKFIFLILDGRTLVGDLNVSEIENELLKCKSFVNSLAINYPDSSIVVSTIDYYDRNIKANSTLEYGTMVSYMWNKYIEDLSTNNSRIIPFGLKELIELNGRKNVYSESMYYMGSIPFSIKGTSLISEAIDKQISQMTTTRKKVLALDLDNTLWGGVVGEDGPQNIVLSESNLGKAYHDAQLRIKALADTGILLTIVSKNNPEDADLAFEQNPFMALKKSDFISIKCNWNTKSQNIKELSKELNVGLDSFVFLDDNEVEREEVKQNAPGVTVVDFPKDVANLPETINKIYSDYFWSNSLTAEDLSKKKQYEENAFRQKEMDTANSLEDYLLGLKISIDINEMRAEQKERVIQLINKTNQFNTNTLRLDNQQLNEYMANNGKVFVANVSDKYGDNGLVVIMLVSTHGENAVIDNFLMSCRVMSRQIEDAFIFAIEKKLYEQGIKIIKASYVKTAKNKPVEVLYERLGFKVDYSSEDEKHYVISLPNNNETLLKCNWR